MLRRGVSLVEVLLAAAILACGAASVLWALSSARGQWLRQDVALLARLLAASALESAVDRARNRDMRYFTVTTSPDEVTRRAAAGMWKQPFDALAHRRARVLEPSPLLNGYFAGPGAPALPEPFDADERRLWERLSYEVRVSYEAAETERGTPKPLDSDRDGVPETDLARIEVEVFARPDDGGEERSACRLTTLVAAHDRTPGATVLGEP